MKTLLLKILPLCIASLIPITGYTADPSTAKFIIEKGEKLAQQYRYREALDEIGWLLSEKSPEIRSLLDSVLQRHPTIANLRLDQLPTKIELGCIDLENADPKETALQEIEEVAKFAAPKKAIEARERIEITYSTEVLSSLKTKCNLIKRAEAEDRENKKRSEAEDRTNKKRAAIDQLSKELNSLPKSFEVRGLNIGSDFAIDLIETRTIQEKLENHSNRSNVKVGSTVEGGQLYFYQNILYKAVYEDIQDPSEIRAVMKQLESKFKGKFSNIPLESIRLGDKQINTGGFHMNIGNYGEAQVIFTSISPVDKRLCLNQVASEMQDRIRFNQKNYRSLEDQFQIDCNEKKQPTQIIIKNKAMDTHIESLHTKETQRKNSDAINEKMKSINEKASKF